MFFCIEIAQAPSRSVFYCNQTSGLTTTKFDQKSEWTTATTLLHNKPLLARISRDLRRCGSGKGRQLGLPSRTSNLTGAGHCDTITFLKREMFAMCTVVLVFSLVFCLLPIAYFSRLVHKLPKQVEKAT